MSTPSGAADRRRAARFVALLLSAATGCAEGAPLLDTPQDTVPQVLERITRPAEGGAIHFVRLVQRGDRYAFEPDEVTLAAGDVVRFVMVGSQPESVAFDPNQATDPVAGFIRSNALHRGILLTDAGQAYDVSFRDAPPGRYPFASIPHAVQGMRGTVVVRE